MSYAINLTTPGGIELYRTKTHTWFFGARATLEPDRVETYSDRTTAERVAEHIEADKRAQYGTDWHARAVRWALAAFVAFGAICSHGDAEAAGKRGSGSKGTISICHSCPIFSASDQIGVVIYSYRPDKTHDATGRLVDTVQRGLEAPEGSALRDRAELCMVLGVKAQRECMTGR